jgi:hypothetical protein
MDRNRAVMRYSTCNIQDQVGKAQMLRILVCDRRSFELISNTCLWEFGVNYTVIYVVIICSTREERVRHRIPKCCISKYDDALTYFQCLVQMGLGQIFVPIKPDELASVLEYIKRVENTSFFRLELEQVL